MVFSLQSLHQEIEGRSIDQVYNIFKKLIENYRNPNRATNVTNRIFLQTLNIQRRDNQNSIVIKEFMNADDEIVKIKEVINEVLSLGFAEQHIVLSSTTSFTAEENRTEGLRQNFHKNMIPVGYNGVGIRYSSV